MFKIINRNIEIVLYFLYEYIHSYAEPIHAFCRMSSAIPFFSGHLLQVFQVEPASL